MLPTRDRTDSSRPSIADRPMSRRSYHCCSGHSPSCRTRCSASGRFRKTALLYIMSLCIDAHNIVLHRDVFVVYIPHLIRHIDRDSSINIANKPINCTLVRHRHTHTKPPHSGGKSRIESDYILSACVNSASV